MVNLTNISIQYELTSYMIINHLTSMRAGDEANNEE